MLLQAAAGEPASMYDSPESREHDIEETVRRHDLAGLLDDAEEATSRLERALRDCDADPATPYTRVPGGDETFPLDSVGRRRLAEVEIHHADLDVGYRPDDWPADFSLAMVKQRQDELAALPAGCPSMVLSSTDVDGLWKFGEGQGPEIHGTVGEPGVVARRTWRRARAHQLLRRAARPRALAMTGSVRDMMCR